MPGWSDVVAIGTLFPGVEEGTWYGTAALKADGKGMLRMRTDPDALVIRVADLEEKEALIQGDPESFFTIPHYDGHPFVLVDLDRVDRRELEELIEEAWRQRASKRTVAAYDERG